MLTLDFATVPELTTNRLLLRNYKLTDTHALFKMRSNENVMKFIHRPRPTDLNDITLLIETIMKNNANFDSVVWAIAWKEEPDEMIGSIGYYRTNFENHRAEVGYMLDEPFWRKGIINEALEETIRFGFEEMKLHSISANIAPANEASRQMLLKHGFKKEAYFREDFYFEGEFLDSEIYGLLNPTG